MSEGTRTDYDMLCRQMLELAEEEPFFSLKLIYRGDKLTGAVLNGRKNLME